MTKREFKKELVAHIAVDPINPRLRIAHFLKLKLKLPLGLKELKEAINEMNKEPNIIENTYLRFKKEIKEYDPNIERFVKVAPLFKCNHNCAFPDPYCNTDDCRIQCIGHIETTTIIKKIKKDGTQ